MINRQHNNNLASLEYDAKKNVIAYKRSIDLFEKNPDQHWQSLLEFSNKYYEKMLNLNLTQHHVSQELRAFTTQLRRFYDLASFYQQKKHNDIKDKINKLNTNGFVYDNYISQLEADLTDEINLETNPSKRGIFKNILRNSSPYDDSSKIRFYFIAHRVLSDVNSVLATPCKNLIENVLSRYHLDNTAKKIKQISTLSNKQTINENYSKALEQITGQGLPIDKLKETYTYKLLHYVAKNERKITFNDEYPKRLERIGQLAAKLMACQNQHGLYILGIEAAKLSNDIRIVNKRSSILSILDELQRKITERSHYFSKIEERNAVLTFQTIAKLTMGIGEYIQKNKGSMRYIVSRKYKDFIDQIAYLQDSLFNALNNHDQDQAIANIKLTIVNFRKHAKEKIPSTIKNILKNIEEKLPLEKEMKPNSYFAPTTTTNVKLQLNKKINNYTFIECIQEQRKELKQNSYIKNLFQGNDSIHTVEWYQTEIEKICDKKEISLFDASLIREYLKQMDDIFVSNHLRHPNPIQLTETREHLDMILIKSGDPATKLFLYINKKFEKLISTHYLMSSNQTEFLRLIKNIYGSKNLYMHEKYMEMCVAIKDCFRQNYKHTNHIFNNKNNNDPFLKILQKIENEIESENPVYLFSITSTVKNGLSPDSFRDV